MKTEISDEKGERQFGSKPDTAMPEWRASRWGDSLAIVLTSRPVSMIGLEGAQSRQSSTLTSLSLISQ